MSVVGEAALGATVGELLKLVIVEAKKVMAFNSSFKDLELTMGRLILILEQIGSSYKRQDLPEDELNFLRETLEKALKLVGKCSQLWKSDLYHRSKYTSEIKKINEDLDKYCRNDMQFIQIRNQMQIKESIGVLSDRVEVLGGRVEGMSLGRNSFMALCSAPDPETKTVGLGWPLTELKKMLFDERTSSIVVCAPPGCGKTTLVTKLCHDEEVKGKFESIFYVTVSKTPNFRLIVQNLFEHNGYTAPTFVNDADATNRLQLLLKEIVQNNSILLVLDDVWREAESMLHNFVVQLPNYKILVTSRSEFPGFGSPFHLETLKDEDARTLLTERAGRPDGISDADYKDLLQKILKHCDGYPLLIKVIGSSLKNRSLNTWKSQVSKLSKGNKILETFGSDVLARLQTSVDALETVLKECFSDLGSFPEDQKIRASTIVDIWVELYGLDEDFHAMKFLEDLSSQSLLKLSTVGRNEHEDGFYNEYIVTQHDILRELAICQSKLESENKMEWKRLNIVMRGDRFPDLFFSTQPINARVLSISTDESFSSRWRDMNSPMVEALVLNFLTPNYALPGFIAKMERLKVLTVIYRGFSPARVSNLACINAQSSLKRIRFEKVRITLLDISQLQLRSLLKLSLVMCNIGEVFYDYNIDVSKALPSLQEIDIDYCSDLEELPYWICEVNSLRKLSITNCNKLSKLPEEIGDLTNLEVLKLSSCIYLCGLPETVKRLQQLYHLDISDCLSLKKLPSEIGALQNLERISMIKCSSCELPSSIQNLKSLKEVKCDEETARRWEQFELKPIKVQLPRNNLGWLAGL